MYKDDSEIKERFKHIPGNDAKFPIEDFCDFKSWGNKKLHTYKYPADSPVALVIIFHGVHAYCNNYAFMAKCFTEIGCEVVAFDYVGHGKSEGTPGFIQSFGLLFDDCSRFVRGMIELYPNLPVYLAGGSLGGSICINLLNHLKEFNIIIKGMVLFSPAIKVNVKCELLGRGLIKTLSTLFPMMKLAKGDPSKFCNDDKVREFMLENPFIYSDKIRAGTLGTALKSMQIAMEAVKEISVPFVVIQGGADQVIDPEMAQIMVQVAKSDIKECWMYPGLSHALLFENEIFEIMQRVKIWLQQRIENDRLS